MIALEQGVVIAGRYTLVRQLARGGMGSVWIARHRDLEIDVTVKFMSPSLVVEAEARMRFEREAKVAARLRSQHVVQVHDYGVESETPYIIMELLKGESLSTRIEREGRLDPPTMARLLVQICKALRTAHEAALVHRDLKPGNIFLAQKDEEEVVKVLDFGIAKSGGMGDAQASTESGVLLGSVHYMSPEQIRSSRTVDHRSDLWSVGVIVYRALTGRLPFPGQNLGDVLVRVCTDEAPLASLTSPGLPPRLDGFFARALARDPDQRFQSATELSDAFRAIALEPPTAAVAPRGEWISKQTVPLGLLRQGPPGSPGEIKILDEAPRRPVSPPTEPLAIALRPDVTQRHSVGAETAPPVVASPRFAPRPPPSTQPSPEASTTFHAVALARPVAPSFAAVEAAKPARRRISWPVWAALGAIVAAAMLGMALRSSAPSVDSDLAPRTGSDATSAIPAPAEKPPPPLPSSPASSAAEPPIPTPPPTVSVPVRAPAVEATVRSSAAPKPKVNPLDRSD